MFLQNMKIRYKLLIMAAISIIGLLLYGLVSYLTLEKIRIDGPYYNTIIDAKDLIADILPPPGYIIESYLLSFQEYITEDKKELEQLIIRSQNLQKDYDRMYTKWTAKLPPGRLKEILSDKSYNLVQEFFGIWQSQFLPAILAGERDKAFDILVGRMTELYKQHREYVDEMVKLSGEEFDRTSEDVERLYKNSLYLGFITWITTVLLSLLFAWYLITTLTRQLKQISGGLESVSNQISSSADQQAQATVHQSSAVNETMTTMDELNSSFEHTQAIASDSSERAQKALKVSQDGNIQLRLMVKNLSAHKEKVAQIVEHILRLSQLTRQIHNIASVTSNLTNQTNILALNAAVQAAHVKQYGEGFSVIATEIRKLADESKKFLSHIDVLSENIQQATDSTIKIVDEGNKTIVEIIQTAEGTNHLFESITEITTASHEGSQQTLMNIKEQGIAVHQVLDAMENLNENSQNAIQGMQQIRQEISHLNGLSNELKQTI